MAPPKTRKSLRSSLAFEVKEAIGSTPTEQLGTVAGTVLSAVPGVSLVTTFTGYLEKRGLKRKIRTLDAGKRQLLAAAVRHALEHGEIKQPVVRVIGSQYRSFPPRVQQKGGIRNLLYRKPAYALTPPRTSFALTWRTRKPSRWPRLAAQGVKRQVLLAQRKR